MSILSDKTGRKTMDGLEPGPSERMDGIAHPGESAPELAPYPLDASMFLPPDAAAQASAKSPTPVQDDLALSHPSSTEFPEVTDDLELLPEEAPETNAWGTLHSQPQPFTGGAQQSAVIDILGPPPTELGLSAEAGSAAASLGAHPAHGTVTSAPVAPQPHPPHHAEVQPVAAPCAPALEFPAEVDSAAPGSTLGLPGLYGPGSGSAVVTSVAPPPLPQATQLSAAPSHGVSPAFAAPSDPTAVSDPSTGPSSGLPVPLNAGAPLLAHAEPIDNSIGAALPSFVGSAQPHSVSQVLEPSGDDIAPALPHPETAASEPSRLAGLEAGATPVDTGAVEAVPVSTGAMSVNAPAVEAGLVNTVALPAVAVDAAAVDAMAVDPPSPEPEPTPRVRDPLYEPPEGSSAVVCGVCRKWFGTASALRAHYKSDMHQSVIYELWDMMEEDDPRFLEPDGESDSEAEPDVTVDGKVFQRAVWVASSAAASWRTFATDVSIPTPGEPVWAKLGLNSMYYPARVSEVGSGSDQGFAVEGGPAVDMATVRFDCGDELRVPLSEVIAPQKLVVGQEVLAARWAGGYCVPATILGYGLLPCGITEGYHVEYAKGPGKRKGLVRPSDIVVPSISDDALARMKAEQVHSTIAERGSMLAEAARRPTVAVEAVAVAANAEHQADAHAATVPPAATATTADTGAVPELPAAGDAMAIDTPAVSFTAPSSCAVEVAAGVAPQPTAATPAAASAAPRGYCGVCNRIGTQLHPLRSCRCGRAFHDYCVTAPWGPEDGLWSTCPICQVLPAKRHHDHAWDPPLQPRAAIIKREALAGAPAKRRRRGEEDPDFDYEQESRPLFDDPNPPKKTKKRAWTTTELNLLLRLDGQGHSANQIAEVLDGRTPAAIAVRLWLIRNGKA